MTLNGHFALNYVFAGMFGAVKHSFRSFATLKRVVSIVGELQTEKNMWHRAVSLRQRGLLV